VVSYGTRSYRLVGPKGPFQRSHLALVEFQRRRFGMPQGDFCVDPPALVFTLEDLEDQVDILDRAEPCAPDVRLHNLGSIIARFQGMLSF